MAYWLFKSEPSSWSWEQQVKAGAKGTPWNGVRNHSAKLNLMGMKKGDLGFFYHSNEGKEIVGIVEVIREHYPDPSDEKGVFCMVDIKAIEPMPKPVTLEDVKAESSLKDMALIKFSRLSVQPVTAPEWKLVRKMGGLKG